MNDDTLRIAIAAALLPVAYLVVKLLAKLIVRVFPSLKKHNEERKD